MRHVEQEVLVEVSEAGAESLVRAVSVRTFKEVLALQSIATVNLSLVAQVVVDTLDRLVFVFRQAAAHVSRRGEGHLLESRRVRISVCECQEGVCRAGG